MLKHPAHRRTALVDLVLAGILSAVAGMVNTAGFYAVGFFSANMTGNVSLISESGATGNWFAVLILVAIVIAFVLGAFTAAIVSTMARTKPHQTYPALVILEGMVLLAALSMGPVLPGYIVAMVLSFAMGLQNATSTLISNAKVRTTHVSGMATDLGIEAAMLIRNIDRSAVLSQFRLHALTICSFLAGGIAAALLHTVAPAAATVVPAAILMATGLMELLRSNYP